MRCFWIHSKWCAAVSIPVFVTMIHLPNSYQCTAAAVLMQLPALTDALDGNDVLDAMIRDAMLMLWTDVQLVD